MKDIKDFSEFPEPYRQIAEGIGIENAEWFAKTFGGEQLYLPTYEAFTRPIRNGKIRAEFNGYNFKYLSKKYGITESYVRSIVADNIDIERAKPNKDQMSFFDF